MTIAIAWIRTIRDCEELVFVTDSRLSGDGRNFDGCPKVMALPRGDCAIAFAGYTGHAYPMMQQLAFAIESHGPLQRGSLDLYALRSHLLKILDSMSAQIASSDMLSAPEDVAPEANFIFGGYSWIKKQFEIWAFNFNRAAGRFQAIPASWVSYLQTGNKIVKRRKENLSNTISLGKIAFAGDQAPCAEEQLAARLMLGCGHSRLARLDMEPFEVVRDMLRKQDHSETIGGAPQVLKVYQYQKSAPLGVFWPNRESGVVHIQGRPCLGYERTDRWVLDPDTLVSEHLSRSSNGDSHEAVENDDT
jgi:hypothetical protein